MACPDVRRARSALRRRFENLDEPAGGEVDDGTVERAAATLDPASDEHDLSLQCLRVVRAVAEQRTIGPPERDGERAAADFEIEVDRAPALADALDVTLDDLKAAAAARQRERPPCRPDGVGRFGPQPAARLARSARPP